MSYFAGRGDALGECRPLAQRARVHSATGALPDAERDAGAAFTIAERNAWLPHEPDIVITYALVKARVGAADVAQCLLDGVAGAGRPDFSFAQGWVAIERRDWAAAVEDLSACGRALREVAGPL